MQYIIFAYSIEQDRRYIRRYLIDEETDIKNFKRIIKNIFDDIGFDEEDNDGGTIIKKVTDKFQKDENKYFLSYQKSRPLINALNLLETFEFNDTRFKCFPNDNVEDVLSFLKLDDPNKTVFITC